MGKVAAPLIAQASLPFQFNPYKVIIKYCVFFFPFLNSARSVGDRYALCRSMEMPLKAGTCTDRNRV